MSQDDPHDCALMDVLRFFFRCSAPDQNVSFWHLQKSNLGKPFFEWGKRLCEFEALTFLPDERIPEYKQVQEQVAICWQQLAHFLSQHGQEHTAQLSARQKRLIIGMACTHLEWREEIGFDQASEEEKKRFLKENPLETFCWLI